MKISTKGRYALRILLDLAQHKNEGFIPLKTIAERQGISKKYLDQIMLILNRSDFLLAARGAQGGYKLTKSPDAYTVGDILRATEGSISPLACLDTDASCERCDSCLSRHVWKGLDDAISQYLDHLTLQDILDKYGSEDQLDFCI